MGFNLAGRKAGSIRGAAAILFLGMACCLAPALAVPPASSSNFQPFHFILFGDPQYNFGHGPGGLQASLERFNTIARTANAIKAPFVLIPGDLVNDANHQRPQERQAEADTFAQGMKTLQVPARMVPGNHDVYDAASLARWRQEHGKDFYAFTQYNCEFICLNSVTLRDPATYPVESKAQLAWLEQALAAARAARRDHIFIVMHHPPIESVDDVTVPMPLRRQLIQMFLNYGVDAVLAGHLHANKEYDSWGGIPIYTVAGTASVYYDERKFGYRVFVVSKRGFRQFYVQLEKEIKPPDAPRRPQLAAAPGGAVALTWSDPTSSSGALRYRVWRDGQAIGETPEPAFTDAAPPAGGKAVYQVSAVGVTGLESAKSQPLETGALRPANLVGGGAVWRAWLGPGRLPYDWKQTAFNDAAWKRGATPLALPGGTAPTAWFRHSFAVGDTAVLRGAVLRLQAADGAVAYLNGKEVARANLPRGMVTSATQALAPASVGTLIEAPIDPALLDSESTNTLAVQVFAAGAGSAALRLDAALLALSDPNGLRVTRGPYLQAGGPTQVTVRWRTSQPCPARVRFGERPDALTRWVDDPTSTVEHNVTVTGLAPGKIYFYSVGAGEERLAGGEPYRVLTPPRPGTALPTRIWVVGDSGTANNVAAAVRDAYLGATQGAMTHLWLMLGDNAYPNATDAEHQAAVFNMYPKLLRNTLLYPCAGNHEYYTRNPATGRPVYYDIFSVPTRGESGGVPSGDPAYYSFDYGNIHFISLDSEGVDRKPNGPMLSWLKKDVADARARKQVWMIAFFHSPPYSKGGHDSDKLENHGETMIEMRQNALPILEEGGVDLVLAGHSHSYERSFLLDGHYGLSNTLQPAMIARSSGNFRVDGPYLKPTLGLAPHEGAIYAVVGSSGQVTPGPLNHPVMCRSLLEPGSMTIDVDGQWLVARFIGADGRLRDMFNLLKGASRNQLSRK